MKNKVMKEFDRATLAGVKKEMAKPRMAKSVREEEANRAAGRIMPVKARKGQAAVASASASSSAACKVVCVLLRG